MKITLNENFSNEDLKKLMLWYNAGQHEEFKINSVDEVIVTALRNEVERMKQDPIGQRLFW